MQSLRILIVVIIAVVVGAAILFFIRRTEVLAPVTQLTQPEPTLAETPFISEGLGFSIRLPQGWKQVGEMSEFPTFTFTASDASANTPWVPTLYIVDDVFYTGDLRVTVQSVKDLKKRFPLTSGEKDEFLSEQYTKIAELDVYLSQSRVTTKSKDVIFRDAGLVTNSRELIYVIGVRVLEKDWQRYGKVIDQSLRSFRLLETTVPRMTIIRRSEAPAPVTQPEQGEPQASTSMRKTYTKFPGVLSEAERMGKIVRLKTTKGDIAISIFGDEAPKTASNFLTLSRDGFYDGLTFHRREEGFVIQGGDPNGNGTGGPGYKFEDEPVKRKYTRGIVAMANSGPNTNGSQFFIMLQDTPLPPNYTIFGEVKSGMDVVDAIEVGDVMERVTVE